jgi:hypothetical protein
MKRSSLVVQTVNDEAVGKYMEYKDTQISCIAAKCLAEPPQAYLRTCVVQGPVDGLFLV